MKSIFFIDGEDLRVSKSEYFPNEKGKLKLSFEGKIRNPYGSYDLEMITRELLIADFLESFKEATRIR